MKKKLFLLFVCCGCLMQWGMAQTPKWVDKAKRAVFSVITYDRNDKILNTGNGFFVTEDGVALSDYTLFKGAQRAVIVNQDGVTMPVESVIGANDMYDVIKFRVALSTKKVPTLAVVTEVPAVGEEVYLLPYSTQKDRSFTAGRVKEVDKVADQYSYYTLDMHLKDKMVSCPLVTAEGKAFGLAQKALGQDTATICYAVDARFAMAQNVTALSFNDLTLRSIGIKKALPDTEEQALVFLFMASSTVTPDVYAGMLDDFVAQYPNCADGYLRRATLQLSLSREEDSMKKVETDMDKALAVALQKDDVHYNRSKMIYSYMLEVAGEQPYKDWSFAKALDEIRQAVTLNPLPVYMQLQGDILYAMQDYAAAFLCYDEVNKSNLVSAATFFSAARAKEMMKAPVEEVLAQMDSCVARFTAPYTQEAAPYLLERARVRMEAKQARNAVSDYDAYYNAVNGNVNALFYYYREQAALSARQYQRALDDITKAIEMEPKELIYRAELAVVNIRVGRSEEALKVLEEVLKEDASYAEAYRLMGLAHLQLKQNQQACDSFAKAKELGDPNVDALIEKHCK